MPVLRNQRTEPLSLTADALNTGIVSAHSWASEDGSTSTSNGVDHSGNARNWTVSANGTPLVVSTTGGNGRDTTNGKTVLNRYYTAPNLNTLGMAVGTGAFSIYRKIRMPSVSPAATQLRSIGRFTDGSAEKLSLSVYEILGTGYVWQPNLGNGTATLVWNDAGNVIYAPNGISILHITRSAAGVLKFYIGGALIKTISGNTTDFLATTNQVSAAGLFSNGNAATGDFILIDDINWNRELSVAEVAAHAANPYAYYTNTSVADSITVSTPANGSTVGTNITISGTYAGGNTPTTVEASFNGGAYADVVVTPTGGTFSGILSGQLAGTGTLTVRWKNSPAILATVASLTVVANSITFTVPNTPATAAVPYRLFQRDASNNATVRITGTYVGTPTNIESRWKGGTWTTLVASPIGGTFDTTRVLSGVGQGALEIRFSNATTITASIAAVGVGDVYLVIGQSNHVGKSAIYVPAVAPVGNPSWLPIERDKAGTWRHNVETAGVKFDDATGAIYSVHADPTPTGSYFGNLATRIMAVGVPCAFIPLAMGSTSIAAWAVNLSTTWLYGAALATATAIGDYKAVLWWQGESNSGDGTTRATYESALNVLVNDWYTRTGKKWALMNINATGCGVGSAGTSSSDNGFNAIHAAIASVAETNANVVGIADMNGAFSGSVHYGTTGAETIEVGLRAFNVLNAAYYARTVTITLVNSVGATLPSLTGLKWALFDQATPDLLIAPSSKGSGASTNVAGVLQLVIPTTGLAVNGTGWLIVSDSDGTTTQSPASKAFCAPVIVA